MIFIINPAHLIPFTVQPLLTVTRKSFILARDDTFRERFMELRKFDTESAHFQDILSELDISFQPR